MMGQRAYISHLEAIRDAADAREAAVAELIAQIKAADADRIPKTEIAKAARLSRATVYKLLGDYEQSAGTS
jgi:DNA invertase Pin-like site-specific DNA recombinase